MFTFYCLVKNDNDYYFKPYINIYNNMIEIRKWSNHEGSGNIPHA
jgi:hypothetical protein